MINEPSRKPPSISGRVCRAAEIPGKVIRQADIQR